MERHEGFARKFYDSRAWRVCREGYAESKRHLCERHHKTKLTPANITDPSITLNWDNLELLCKDCHLAEHETHRERPTRWKTDEEGRVILDTLPPSHEMTTGGAPLRAFSPKKLDEGPIDPSPKTKKGPKDGRR